MESIYRETHFKDAPASLEVNYFDTPGAAQRYATSRPRGHGRALAVLARTLASQLPVERAADVGCGTGHSTIALLPYARAIVGVEASSEMLAQAAVHPRIDYRKGYAEALPLRDAEFNLVTVSSAYHWFDQERFLVEAARVLKPQGWLVLYKTGSTGRMPECAEFEAWRRGALKARYPKIARSAERLAVEQARAFGFSEIVCETLTHRERHALDDYVENLLTHSRFLRVVESGAEPVSAVRAWLRDELAPFFPDGGAELVHEAWIHVLCREV